MHAIPVLRVCHVCQAYDVCCHVWDVRGPGLSTSSAACFVVAVAGAPNQMSVTGDQGIGGAGSAHKPWSHVSPTKGELGAVCHDSSIISVQY